MRERSGRKRGRPRSATGYKKLYIVEKRTDAYVQLKAYHEGTTQSAALNKIVAEYEAMYPYGEDASQAEPVFLDRLIAGLREVMAKEIPQEPESDDLSAIADKLVRHAFGIKEWPPKETMG